MVKTEAISARARFPPERATITHSPPQVVLQESSKLCARGGDVALRILGHKLLTRYKDQRRADGNHPALVLPWRSSRNLTHPRARTSQTSVFDPSSGRARARRRGTRVEAKRNRRPRPAISQVARLPRRVESQGTMRDTPSTSLRSPGSERKPKVPGTQRQRDQLRARNCEHSTRGKLRCSFAGILFSAEEATRRTTYTRDVMRA